MASDLFFETAGDTGHPHLVLLHGFLSSNLQWQPNRASLQSALRLVMPELWGHGRSPCPPRPADYSAAAYVEALERIREGLGVERWCVLGQSYGAGIAVQYGLRYPQRTSGVIVTNSRSMFGSIPDGVPTGVLEAQFRDRRRLAMHPIHARLLPTDLKARLVAAADAVDQIAAVHGMQQGHSLRCHDRLAALEVPLLVVNGAREIPFQRDLNRLRAAHPRLDVTDIDAGHAVNLEAPRAFNTAVVDFCRRVTTGLDSD